MPPPPPPPAVSSTRAGLSGTRHCPEDQSFSKSNHASPTLRGTRLRSATVLDRPRTSSGPASSQAANLSKRTREDLVKTRDDLHIADMMAPKAILQSSRLPTSGPPSSHQPSPHLRATHTPPHAKTRAAASDPALQPSPGEAFGIGMALGSPSRQTAATASTSPAKPLLSRRAFTGGLRTPEYELSPHPHGAMDGSRTKSRKWGIFGRSKPKKNSPNPSVSKPSPSGEQLRQGSARQDDMTKHRNTPSKSSPPPGGKPVVIRSQTAPLISDVPRQRKPGNGSSAGSPANTTGKPLPPKPRVRPQQAGRPSGLAVPSSKDQLLNVEIPNVELERYSVMFSGVLNPSTAAHSNRANASLLDRRRATLDKLRMLKDSAIREEAERADHLAQEIQDQGPTRLRPPPPRRATSPNPTGSPSFSLFPATPKQGGSPHHVSPRPRSGSSPAFLPSPSKSGFDAQEVSLKGQQASARLVVQKSRARPSQGGLSEQWKPRSSSKLRSSPDTSQPSDTTAQEPAAYLPTGPKRTRAAPDDIITQTAFMSSSDTLDVDRATPRTIPQAAEPEEDEASRALREAVEQSIKRQISLSQQQRVMIRERHANASRAREGGSPDGAAGRPAGGPQNVALAATRTATPTLVHPGHDGYPSPDYRRSERIVFEEA